MRWSWLASGALCGALAVMAGAFGAHALAARLDAHGLALWETAARYLMYGGLAQMALGLLTRSAGPATGGARLVAGAGLCLFLGSLVFSGTVGALALGAPRFLGAVTPLGGLGIIAGFVLLAAAALRSS